MSKKTIFRVVDSHKYSKLGLRRKKKVVYRKPRGRDNKIRLNMKGKLRKVKVGFKSSKEERGLIKKNGQKKFPFMIYNIKDLKKIRENNIGIIANIGDKKKKEISEYALHNKVYLLNLNPKKFLAGLEKKKKKTKEEKIEKEKKMVVKEKIVEEKKEEELKEKTDQKLEEKIEEKTESNLNKQEIKKEEMEEKNE
ncbi:MAG: eL32 family ribosomal protein [Nanoarchaeota archaeon]